MTKSKTKTEIVSGCFNCNYSKLLAAEAYDKGAGVFYPQFYCTLDKKKYHAEYTCKKWRIME